MPKRRADGPITRRRNPEATRKKLLTAARREFANRGLAGARVDDIAERAGVNKQLVYHYFGDKDAHIPMDVVDNIKQKQPHAEIYVYDEADHGFHCDERGSYHAESSKIAWERTMTFLTKNMA